MKKSKKLLSVFCALSLLFAALPAASAVEREPLSEYAGQTITVQAIEQGEAGQVSRLVEVAIPQGATASEARTLIYATAFNWDMASAHSDRFYVTDLGGKDNFTLSSLEETEIVNRTLKSELNEIYVTFHVGSHYPNARIEGKVDNITAGTSSRWEQDKNISDPTGNVIKEVVFRTSNIRMDKGDEITIYAKSSGNMTITACNVTGYYRL